jgi:hypothetical protein
MALRTLRPKVGAAMAPYRPKVSPCVLYRRKQEAMETVKILSNSSRWEYVLLRISNGFGFIVFPMLWGCSSGGGSESRRADAVRGAVIHARVHIGEPNEAEGFGIAVDNWRLFAPAPTLKKEMLFSE